MNRTCVLYAPVVRYSTDVRYSHRRRLTVVEEMILRLVQEPAIRAHYGKLDLERICSDFMGIAEPERVVGPVLQTLCAAGLVALRHPASSLREVTVENLSLTRSGQQMLQQGHFPSRSRTRQYGFVYDPIARTFDVSGKLYSEPNEPTLPLELADGTFPAERAREYLARSNLPWLEGAEIEEIEPTEHEILWRRILVRLSIEQGEVLMEVRGQPEYAGYFQSMAADSLYDLILASAFDQNHAATAAVTAIAVEYDARGKALPPGSYRTVPQLASELFSDSHLVAVRAELLEWARSNTRAETIVVLDAQCDGLSIRKQGNVTLVHVPPPGNETNLVAADPERVAYAVRLLLRAGRGSVTLTLAQVDHDAERARQLFRYVANFGVSLRVRVER